ncbi:MAG: molybdopterin-dependent oxidoreductase [Telluria sp.]
MNRFIQHLAAVVALTVPAAVCAAPEVPDPSKYMTSSVAVSGSVETKLALRVDDLRNFPPQQVIELTLPVRRGAPAGHEPQRVKGVRLRDVLSRAAVVTHHYNDVKKMIIVASASDGYKVVFSWNELFNTPVGDGVLVIFERDGKPLANTEGQIALVSAADFRAGSRHVKWLQSIEIRKAVE